MADTLSTEIRAGVSWLFLDSLDLSTVSDASRLEYSVSLADGISNDQADKIWHDQRTLAAGASEDLDLTALSRTLFDGTFTTGVLKVKALMIVNLATTSGYDLTVGGAPAQTWVGPFGTAADKVKVPADSCLLLVNKKSGWSVTNSSADLLRITNTAAGSVTYNLAIVGTSS